MVKMVCDIKKIGRVGFRKEGVFQYIKINNFPQLFLIPVTPLTLSRSYFKVKTTFNTRVDTHNIKSVRVYLVLKSQNGERSIVINVGLHVVTETRPIINTFHIKLCVFDVSAVSNGLFPVNSGIPGLYWD